MYQLCLILGHASFRGPDIRNLNVKCEPRSGIAGVTHGPGILPRFTTIQGETIVPNSLQWFAKTFDLSRVCHLAMDTRSVQFRRQGGWAPFPWIEDGGRNSGPGRYGWIARLTKTPIYLYALDQVGRRICLSSNPPTLRAQLTHSQWSMLHRRSCFPRALGSWGVSPPQSLAKVYWDSAHNGSFLVGISKSHVRDKKYSGALGIDMLGRHFHERWRWEIIDIG